MLKKLIALYASAKQAYKDANALLSKFQNMQKNIAIKRDEILREINDKKQKNK